MILIDTDIMIDLLRGYRPAVDWLDNLGQEEIKLPGYVVMELIHGCSNRAELESLERWLNSLGGYSVAWPSSETCNKALSMFGSQHLSHGIGIIDALIGHMAVEDLKLSLHTFNQRHYSAILGLITVQPYEK